MKQVLVFIMAAWLTLHTITTWDDRHVGWNMAYIALFGWVFWGRWLNGETRSGARIKKSRQSFEWDTPRYRDGGFYFNVRFDPSETAIR